MNRPAPSSFDLVERADSPPPDSNPIDAATARRPIKFEPTVFKFRDATTIPRRQFVYGRHYIRQFLSATVAPGGVGKSSLALVEAVAMASGRCLLGVQPPRQLRVWYVNLEDPRQEIERRVVAICLHFRIDLRDIENRLFFDVAKSRSCSRGRRNRAWSSRRPSRTRWRRRSKTANSTFSRSTRSCRLTVSPRMTTLRSTPSPRLLGRIAGSANCAIECVHHTRKNNGAEVTAEDSRGAGAMAAAARSVRVLNRMSDDEADKAGVAAEDRRYYPLGGRQDERRPARKGDLVQDGLVALGTGSGGDVDDQDYVGVATPWAWPDAFDGVSVADLRAVQARVSEGRYRANSQANDWVGNVVADVLGLDLTDKAHKAKTKTLLAAWIKNGMFVTVEGQDDTRRTRQFIEVGTPADG